jgi:hypothetical protein
MVSETLVARPLNQEEIRAAVETWVRYVTADARPDATVDRMEPYVIDEDTILYVVHLSERGFCFTSADDIGLPAYLYSPYGIYMPDDPANENLLCAIGSGIKDMKEKLKREEPDVRKFMGELQKRGEYWYDLIAGIIPETQMVNADRSGPDSMSLHLTCEWNQVRPYNAFCPKLPGPPSLMYTKAGCVAIAFAQILYYWQWPLSGVGQESVTFSYRGRENWDSTPLTNGPNITGGPWDEDHRDILKWVDEDGDGEGALMMQRYWDQDLYKKARKLAKDLPTVDSLAYLNSLEFLYNRLTPYSEPFDADFGATAYRWNLIQDTHSSSEWDEGDEAVAELCLHAGISVNMDYGTSGSGASTGAVAQALPDHFRYSADAVYDSCNRDLIIEEIQWLRPVQLKVGNSCSHSIVLCGYDIITGQFLRNQGYGAPVHWISLDEICVFQKHIRYFAPENVVKFVGASVPGGDGSPVDPYINIEDAIVNGHAPDGATLIFKAGSNNTFAASQLVINKPLILKGRDAIIRKE